MFLVVTVGEIIVVVVVVVVFVVFVLLVGLLVRNSVGTRRQLMTAEWLE